MTSEIFFDPSFRIAALIAVCWMLTEYWLGVPGRGRQ